jgi:hypothetical protein
MDNPSLPTNTPTSPTKQNKSDEEIDSPRNRIVVCVAAPATLTLIAVVHAAAMWVIERVLHSPLKEVFMSILVISAILIGISAVAEDGKWLKHFLNCLFTRKKPD